MMFERHDHVSHLCGKQGLVYNVLSDHYQKNQSSQLKLIITGQGGSGKSYVTNALKIYLKSSVLLRLNLEFYHSVLEV